MVGKTPAMNIPFPPAWSGAYVLEKLAAPLNRRPFATRHTLGLIGRNLDIDNHRAKEELGRHTRVFYSQAMEQIREWVRSQYRM